LTSFRYLILSVPARKVTLETLDLLAHSDHLATKAFMAILESRERQVRRVLQGRREVKAIPVIRDHQGVRVPLAQSELKESQAFLVLLV
jgi:hypothetical protein